MDVALNRRASDMAIRDCWTFAQYALRSNRVELLRRFELAVGPPSEPMFVLQQEFLNDRMPPEDLSAFVDVCCGLIAAAEVKDEGWPA